MAYSLLSQAVDIFPLPLPRRRIRLRCSFRRAPEAFPSSFPPFTF